MLVYPLSFYAVNGITKILRSIQRTRVRWRKLSERVVRLILVLPFFSGLVFMSFVATGVYGGSVPLRDVNGTIRAMRWLDAQMGDGSALLVHAVFSNWARLYLDEGCIRIHFKDNIEGAISVALQRDFNDIYFVWWNERIGLYDLTVPNCFTSIFRSGRISVFKYNSAGA